MVEDIKTPHIDFHFCFIEENGKKRTISNAYQIPPLLVNEEN